MGDVVSIFVLFWYEEEREIKGNHLSRIGHSYSRNEMATNTHPGSCLNNCLQASMWVTPCKFELFNHLEIVSNRTEIVFRELEISNKRLELFL